MNGFPFDELLVELCDVILNEFVDPLSKFFLALTSKKFFNKLKFPKKLRLNKFTEMVSFRWVGGFGNARQLDWFIDNHWKSVISHDLGFPSICRGAVVFANPGLFFGLLREEKTSELQLYPHSDFTRPVDVVELRFGNLKFAYQKEEFNYDLGVSGSQSMINEFSRRGFTLDIDLILDGVCYGGHTRMLTSFPEYREWLARSSTCFFDAAAGGQKEMMGLLIAEKQYCLPPQTCSRGGKLYPESFLNKIMDDFPAPHLFPDYDERVLAFLEFLGEQGVDLADYSLMKTAYRAIMYLDLPRSLNHLQKTCHIVEILARSDLHVGLNFALRRGNYAAALALFRIVPDYCTSSFDMETVLMSLFEWKIRSESSRFYDTNLDDVFELVSAAVSPSVDAYRIDDDIIFPHDDDNHFIDATASVRFAHFLEQFLQLKILFPHRVMRGVTIRCPDIALLKRLIALYLPLEEKMEYWKSSRDNLFIEVISGSLERPFEEIGPLWELLYSRGEPDLTVVTTAFERYSGLDLDDAFAPLVNICALLKPPLPLPVFHRYTRGDPKKTQRLFEFLRYRYRQLWGSSLQSSAMQSKI